MRDVIIGAVAAVVVLQLWKIIDVLGDILRVLRRLGGPLS